MRIGLFGMVVLLGCVGLMVALHLAEMYTNGTLGIGAAALLAMAGFAAFIKFDARRRI